jgi:glycosyltransferase involved in cell wall biosynthesis
MKIFIDGAALFGRRTGVGQYTKRLLEKVTEIDSGNKYTVFGFLFVGKKLTPPISKKLVKYRLIRFMPGRVYNKILKANIPLPVDLLMAAKPDVIFFPNFVRWPLAFGEKSIIVIYDLSYLSHGQHAQDANRRYLTKFVPRSISKASAIVTISENSKREIMEEYGVSEDRITIINPALDHQEYRPRSEAEVAAVRQKFMLDKPYILYTGTLEPRKNIVGVLEAYAALPEKLRGNYSLVLAGGKGWQDEEIKAKLNELSNLDILQTGYIADDDLPPLYTGASVFVYPSHYEGFGMPPLEAMACGTPVITSNNSSLPEVVREAGIMIEATDTNALTANIQKVLTDQALADNLRKKGFEQAAKFTWEESATRFKVLIEKVGAK